MNTEASIVEILKNSSKYLKAVFHREPPDYLYHYTDAKGLYGIFDKMAIWATNAGYLNDSKELSIAFEISESELEKKRSKAKTVEEQLLFAKMLRNLRNNSELDIRSNYVCSFSEIRDSLSQWRAYCSEGGYSLGLPSEFLKKRAELQRFTLVPCIYEKQEQHGIIAETISLCLDRFRNNKSKLVPEQINREIDSVSYYFTVMVMQIAPIIKHKSFEEEKEWRLITLVDKPKRSHPEYRCGRSMLIPYRPFKLIDKSDILNDLRVVVGPTPHPERAKESAGWFLFSRKCSQPNIKISNSPYQHW